MNLEGATHIIRARAKVRHDTKIDYNTTDKSYEFVIVDVNVKNLGNIETTAFASSLTGFTWTVKVDNGYVYKEK